MKTLVIMHDASEGLGTLEDYFAFKRVSLSTVRLYAGEALPESVQDYDAVVSMGGPMNVYQDEIYPFLRDEAAFLKQAICFDVPILGICLGAQIIARACGGPVYKASARELGWNEVLLTKAGMEDRLFIGLPHALTVFQWHEDNFDLPSGAKLLATSSVCPHQAFRYRNAYGLQFHVELTPRMLCDWFGSSPGQEEMLRQFEAMEPDFIRQALRLYSNFLGLVKSRNAHVSRSEFFPASVRVE